MTPKGFVGLQVHSFDGDAPAQVRWRNIFVREIGGKAEEKVATTEDDARILGVIDEVEKECLRRPVYTIGRQRAELLARVAREVKPRVAVECGTAIGYSGLWIARELKRAGGGKLISIEISPDRAREAEENFRKAGLADLVTVKVGDAKEVTKTIEGPIDLVFIDCDFGNYERAFLGLEGKLRDGAVVVSDNVVMGASGMAAFLEHIRSRYPSYTEWFEKDLPWGEIDGMEVTRIAR
jgi:predicted O-methyltransferase YrrM